MLRDAELIDATVVTLVEDRAVGWFQGRMEFGPRALGARSILGDPRSPTMQSVLRHLVSEFRLQPPLSQRRWVRLGLGLMNAEQQR